MSGDTPRCSTAVLKIASRCNLNCKYCYVYNLGDNTWRDQPPIMSQDVVECFIRRVREHCLSHNLSQFVFIFHGGEPLLAGPSFFEHFVNYANRTLLPEISSLFTLQTNGTLLTKNWCTLFSRLGIGFGVSLDGPRAINDQNRIDHAGRGSYDRVIRGIDIALQNGIRPGLLTVIDPLSDPDLIYEHVLSLGIEHIDFLLPEATYEVPPPGYDTESQLTLYADWLIRIFDRWFTQSPAYLRIRIFETIIASILGMPVGLDTMGTDTNEVLVIEADGGIEPIGSLKICGNGFTKIGADVFTHSLDEALDTELARHYVLSGQMLCSQCQGCPIRETCGGGYLPHRYHQENGFDNPSVYCRDLTKLITHIQNTVYDTYEGSGNPIPITRLTFEEARRLLSEHLSTQN
jgi:uncharacterized protein